MFISDFCRLGLCQRKGAIDHPTGGIVGIGCPTGQAGTILATTYGPSRIFALVSSTIPLAPKVLDIGVSAIIKHEPAGGKVTLKIFTE
jgi:hypothetical protein